MNVKERKEMVDKILYENKDLLNLEDETFSLKDVKNIIEFAIIETESNIGQKVLEVCNTVRGEQ